MAEREGQVSAIAPAGNPSVAYWAALRRIAAKLPTYAADVVDNPEWLAMFALGRVLPIRHARARLLAPRATIPPVAESLFKEAAAAPLLAGLECHGFAAGLVLPEDLTAQILDFARTVPCFGNYDRRLAFLPDEHAAAEACFGRKLLTGHYFDAVAACPALLAVQQDALLHAVARAYLGVKARLAATRLWWSFPTEAAEADLHLASQDRFHFDLDDWQTLKFFFYLTAVDEEAGPHVYVLGSHRRRLWRHQLTLLVGHPAAEVEAAYGPDSILPVLGPAGFGFTEDPFGFHMGTAPRRARRLMLEIAFGVSAASRRRFYGEQVVR
jgi:hypothetical protein